MISRRQFVLAGAAAGLAGLALPGWADDHFQSVISTLRGFVEAGQLPFASIRIARHGEVLVESHIGGQETIGPDSVYRLYSMTKPVVAAGVMRLVDDGKLALEDRVDRYLPEFADLKVVAAPGAEPEPARPMSVAQLLTHSCGLANSWGAARVAPSYREAGLIAGAWMYDPEIGGLAGFAQRLGTLPLEFQPGSDWVYGYGLDIAGLVIERVSGQRLGEFLAQRIFAPLGMASAGFFVPEGQADRLAGLYHARPGGIQRASDGSERLPLKRPFADAGSGGLLSTLEDYGRFADMLANGGKRGAVRILSAESVRTMTSPNGPQAPLMASLTRFGRYPAGSVGFGLGGVVRLDDRSGPGSAGEYAWGGAAGTGFWATPALGLSMTLMTQLMPVTALPARDALRPMIYEALAAAG